MPEDDLAVADPHLQVADRRLTDPFAVDPDLGPGHGVDVQRSGGASSFTALVAPGLMDTVRRARNPTASFTNSSSCVPCGSIVDSASVVPTRRPLTKTRSGTGAVTLSIPASPCGDATGIGGAAGGVTAVAAELAETSAGTTASSGSATPARRRSYRREPRRCGRRPGASVRLAPGPRFAASRTAATTPTGRLEAPPPASGSRRRTAASSTAILGGRGGGRDVLRAECLQALWFRCESLHRGLAPRKAQPAEHNKRSFVRRFPGD